MTKTDKFGGKQHIKYSKNEEAIGDFKNGNLINGFYKSYNEEEGEYILEFQNSEIFKKINNHGTYSFYIRNS